MPNSYGAPEIDVQTLSRKLAANEPFILMDVRESYELGLASLKVPQLVFSPLSLLAREQTGALPDAFQDKDAEIIVMCHHGVRSAQVTAWLLHHGWKNAVSVAGGIDAYAREVDPSVGFY